MAVIVGSRPGLLAAAIHNRIQSQRGASKYTQTYNDLNVSAQIPFDDVPKTRPNDETQQHIRNENVVDLAILFLLGCRMVGKNQQQRKEPVRVVNVKKTNFHSMICSQAHGSDGDVRCVCVYVCYI